MVPVEERIKNDFNFILSKNAELFVNSDQLKKELLLEELNKFRETNKLELENITLREELKRKEEELARFKKNNEGQQEKSLKEIQLLRKDLTNEKKDKLILMNQMIKSLENEKNTRMRVYGYLAMEDEDQQNLDEENRVKDRLAHNFDDVGLG